MNDYRQLSFKITPYSDDASDILAQLLADAGCESFTSDLESSTLTAYIPERLFDINSISESISQMPFDAVEIELVESTFVEGIDWNAEWEKNYFKPIIIDDNIVIHSSFHTDIPRCRLDITIDPKMAFGTGHHSTTSLILRRLLQLDLRGKHLIDMGTGTGILAITAAMLGAERVDAIEIDPAAHANAAENVAINHHPEINVILGDASALEPLPSCDIMLANITRNIILADLPRYAARIKPGGTLILSGFYESPDAEIIIESAAGLGFASPSITTDNGWCSLSLSKARQ